MSSRFSWRESREEGPKTHTSKRLKQKSIPKPERKWLHVFERFIDWFKRCEALQKTAENVLHVFEVEMLKGLLGSPYDYLEMTE
jgi:hypothetical protein